MTERQGQDLLGALRARLGVRHRAGPDDGRAELVRVAAAELGLGRDEAEAAVGALIDSGRIRYIVGTERDVEHDVAAQSDEHSDVNARDDGATERSDNLTINAIPGRGNDRSGGVSRITEGASAPLVQGGFTGAPGATPLAAGVDIGDSAAERQRMGYWDLGDGAAGVVPSATRKGQVEPRGT